MAMDDKTKEKIINWLQPEELVQKLTKDIDTLSEEAPKAISSAIKEKRLPAIEPQFRESATVFSRVNQQMAAAAKKHNATVKDHTDVLKKTIEKRQQRMAAYALAERKTTATKKGTWIVMGRITDKASGKGVANVRVSAYDMDRKLDDYLDSTRTDALGYYRIEYTERDFKDLGDKQPETYIVVVDDDGNKLHTSSKSFVEKSKPATKIDAAIDGGKVPEKMAISNNIDGFINERKANWTARDKVLTHRKSITAKAFVRKDAGGRLTRRR